MVYFYLISEIWARKSLSTALRHLPNSVSRNQRHTASNIRVLEGNRGAKKVLLILCSGELTIYLVN